MIENSKIIVIKSSNEENIQKSKDHSLWATTFSNQVISSIIKRKGLDIFLTTLRMLFFYSLLIDLSKLKVSPEWSPNQIV